MKPTFIVVATSSVFLFGFTDIFFQDNPLSNVQEYMKNVVLTTKPHENIQKEQKSYTVTYLPYILKDNVQDPFLIKNFVATDGDDGNLTLREQCQSESCGDGPPAPHIPYYLEHFPIDQLTMVGTIQNMSGDRDALIKLPDGEVVQTRRNEYIGKNNGLVLKVLPNEIIIQEKIRSVDGWKNRENHIQLIR